MGKPTYQRIRYHEIVFLLLLFSQDRIFSLKVTKKNILWTGYVAQLVEGLPNIH